MNDKPLSQNGIARRDRILLLARGEARRRRRRRFAGRGGVVLVVVALAFSLTLHRRPETGPQPYAQPQPIARISHPLTSEPVLTVQYLQTDPTITDRLTIKPSPPRWTSIDDHELLTELATAGQPAGIVSMNGRTFLLPR